MHQTQLELDDISIKEIFNQDNTFIIGLMDQRDIFLLNTQEKYVEHNN